MTLVALIGQVIAGHAIGARAAIELENLKLNVAEQQERAANAELETAKVKSRLNPRGLPVNFLDVMKTKPKGRAQIIYQSGDPEINGFTRSLWFHLTAAGWEIPEPKEVPSVFELKKDFSLGEVIFKSYDSEHLPEHIEVLREQLWSVGINVQSIHDTTMAKDAPVQILIAAKIY